MQERSLDIVQGIALVKDVQKQLYEIREDVDEWHSVWYSMAKNRAEEEGTEEPGIPRLCGRQKYRDSSCTEANLETPEVYYQRVLTIPFLDHLASQLQEQFTEHAKTASLGLCLVPSVLLRSANSEDNLQHVIELYRSDLPSPSSLTVELQLWKNKFKSWCASDLPSTPVQALNNCNELIFPNIATLLKIFCTLPVTSCEVERSFSSLRRLKTYLQSTMGEERLTGLALLTVHRDKAINLDNAIDRFALVHPRRLQFL